MAGYLATSKTVVAKDTYSSYYQQASVDISVDASGKVSWKITVTNDGGGKKGRGINLLVKIGGKTVENTGYTSYDDKDDPSWSTYPTGNNKSKSGSFTLSDNSVGSLAISIGICCMQSNISTKGTTVTDTFVRTKWEDVSDGTLEIEDHFNNSFNIKATPGSGTNNLVLEHKVVWGYSSDYDSNTGTGDGLKSLTISGTKAERTVYVKSLTRPTYGTAGVKTGSKSIRQYIKPGAPGKPVISYSKNRLTIREPWKFTWPEAKAANTSSPIKGYRIRIIKNGVAIIGLGCGTSDNIILDSKNKNNYVDRESTSCTITFNPVDLEFKAGDTVSVGIYSYTRYGENYTGSQIFNGDLSEDQVLSKTCTVQNAGIVRIKEGGSWREGQVYVKVNGTWKEAETVYTKVDGSWKESQ
jgi:hypothetical protein